MYTSKKDLNSDSQGEKESFESFVKGIEIPQLNTEERDSLDHDFTYEELKEVVSSFSDNKTPGEDGFIKEFYESFYDLIWRDLLNFYDAAFQILNHWFNHCQNTAIALSSEKVAFHDIHHVTDMLSGPVRRRLDLLIISIKQYIYSSKHLQKELSLDEVVKKLITQWKLEKCI